MSAEAVIRAELVRAARALGVTDSVEPVVERPRDPAHGDWATNLAMMLARPLKRKPADIAKELIAAMNLAERRRRRGERSPDRGSSTSASPPARSRARS